MADTPTPKTETDWLREILEGIAERGGLPKRPDLQELRRLGDKLGSDFEGFVSAANFVGEAICAEAEIPFEIEAEDVATLALAASAMRELGDELVKQADALSGHILAVDYAHRRQAGELTY